MWKRCQTGCAGSYTALPPCEAVIVHQPTPVRCTFMPATVQGPEPESVTGRFEVVDTFTLKSRSPRRLCASVVNRIVWLFSVGHVAGVLPSAEQAAPAVFGVSAHADARRLVASSSAAPASRMPQPIPRVQSALVRVADCLRMSAT